MLIKITNFCSMGCSHCVEDSTIRGEHMTEETFRKALDMTRRVETLAWKSGCPPILGLTGGECTEHPDIVRFVEIVYEQKMMPVLVTNGMWLSNKELRKALLRREWPHLFVQVTNDSRFYPKAPPRHIVDKRIMYIDAITMIHPLGRAVRWKGGHPSVPLHTAPISFNLRSITRSLGSVELAVGMLRRRSAYAGAGQCTPSVTDRGDVVAGDSRNCYKIGTVDSSNAELTKALIEIRCNKCGLEDKLTQEQKRAIGISTLYLGHE